MKPPLLPKSSDEEVDSLPSDNEDSFDDEPKFRDYQLALIRRFEFSSKLQRQSVIVKNLANNSFRTFVKGSPELIREHCNSSSLPNNYEEILEIYTQSGYRVIALATKQLKISYLKA